MQETEGEPELGSPDAGDAGTDDPWDKGGDNVDPWSSATPPPPSSAGVPAPKQMAQAGTGEPPAAEPQQVWGNFQAGQAEAPEASWKEGSGERGKGGCGGGRKWGNDWWKDRQPSGPNLPRNRVSSATIVGEVLEWKGKYGWIQPTEPFDHPKASMRNGKIFISRTDLADGRELAPGTMCQFYVFEDEAGLGAEECVPIGGAQPGRDARPPGRPPVQNHQPGFNRPPPSSGGQPRGKWGGKGSWDGGKDGGKNGGKDGGKDGGKAQKGDGRSRGKDGGGKGKGGPDGRKGRSKGGQPPGTGGDEFSLPGYVSLKQQPQQQPQQQLPGKGGFSRGMPRGGMMGGLHEGLPDEPNLGGLQAGMRGLQLGQHDMQQGGKLGREGRKGGRGGGRGGGGGGHPRGAMPPVDDQPRDLSDAFGLGGYSDLRAGSGRFPGMPGTMPGVGGLPLGGPSGIPLGQTALGALPTGLSGLPPGGQLPLPGGQGPSWAMQPGHSMDQLLGGSGNVGMGMPGSLSGLGGGGAPPPPPPQHGGLGMLSQLQGSTGPGVGMQPAGWGSFMPPSRLQQGMPGQTTFGSW